MLMKAVCVFALVFGASSAVAQNNRWMTVTFPTNFSIGNQPMSAGIYEILVPSDKALVQIRRVDGAERDVLFAAQFTTIAPKDRMQAHATLYKYGDDQAFLRELRDASGAGFELAMSRAEHECVTTKFTTPQTTSVPRKEKVILSARAR